MYGISYFLLHLGIPVWEFNENDEKTSMRNAKSYLHYNKTTKQTTGQSQNKFMLTTCEKKEFTIYQCNATGKKMNRKGK